jgi:superfamily II DNA or RNA helicase
MKVELYNLVTKVIDAKPEEDIFLQQILRYTERKDMFRFSKELGKTELVDASPVRMLYNLADYTFAGGLTAYVRRLALKEGFTFEFVDKRVKPCERVEADLSFIDRPVLLEAIDACVTRTRGMISMPTGVGKTSLVLGLARVIPCPWMLLTPSNDTFDTIFSRWQRVITDEPIGRIGDGKVDVQRVTVASFQTLESRLKNNDAVVRQAVRTTKAIAIDEVHTVAAPGRLRVAMSFQQAYWRIGLSATPMSRPDGRDMITMGATGDIIFHKTIEDVKDVLARGQIFMVECEQHSDKKTYGGAYRELIIESRARNNLITAIAKQAARPGLVLVTKTKHGENLLHLFNACGFRTQFVTGDDDGDARNLAISRLESGELDFIIATIFHTGRDIPALRSVLNAGAGDSPTATIQKAGRGSRKTDGKDTFEVWDIFDTDENYYSDKGIRVTSWLEKHSAKRKKNYRSEGYQVTVLKELF